MKYVFRRSVVVLAVVAMAAITALSPGAAKASTAEGSVVIQAPSGQCGNDTGGPQVGTVNYSLKGTQLSLGVTLNFSALGFFVKGLKSSYPVSIWQAGICQPLAGLGNVTTNRNNVGNAKFTWTAPCSGGSYFIVVDLGYDLSDSLVFTLPATC